MNFERGDSVCSNRVRVRRDVLEQQLLAGIQSKILCEEVVHYALNRFEEQLLKELEHIDREMGRMKKRKTELEAEIQRLTAGLASGIHSASVMGEIAKREREVSEISDRSLSSRPESIHSKVKKLRASALNRMRDVRAVLNSDVQTARAFLTKHVEKIVMQPDGGSYVASGSWNLLGGIPWECAEGQNRTAYAGLFRAALYR